MDERLNNSYGYSYDEWLALARRKDPYAWVLFTSCGQGTMNNSTHGDY